MELVTKIEFNEKEKQALQALAKLKCDGIACVECPFAKKEIINERTDDFLMDGCVINDIRGICNRYRINYERSVDD